MKRILALVLLLGPAVPAIATPYFRPLDIAHPQVIAGALLDVKDIGNSASSGLLPLVTHSPSDGCILPSIVCESWTPIAVGASMNSGKLTFDVGPVANVLPWMQNFGRLVIPTGWSAIRSVVDYDPAGDPITFSAGPMFEYQQATNHGYFKIFTGLALHF